jgi:molybdopterin synthase catalytic subunit
MIRVQSDPIDVAAVMGAVEGPGQGGVVLFVGRVRNSTRGLAVTRLEYEAYGSMALSELEALAEQAAASHGAERVAMVHRTGRLEIGDAAVAIAVSAAHRAQAFSACSWLIDTLKQRVPIWKKEIYQDGSEWTSPNP